MLAVSRPFSMQATLVDAIYEASFIPEKWDDVLQGICEVSGSASSSLLLRDVNAVPGWRASARVREVVAHFATTDAWKTSERDPARLIEASVGDQYFHCANDIMSPEQIARDAYLQLIDREGLGWHTGTAIPMPTHEFVVLVVEREKTAGRHSSEELARLNALRPHLARAGLLATRLGIERARGSLEAMTAIGLPAALLDVKGCVREANALMTAEMIGTRAGEVIVLDHAAGDETLALMLSGAIPPRSIALPANGARQGRVAHPIPLRGHARDLFAGNLFLLVMNVVGGPAKVPDVAILRGLFDLSPAEARLTVALADGKELMAAAAQCGIRYSTARSYLERIFHKTGMRRQTELVALVSGCLI